MKRLYLTIVILTILSFANIAFCTYTIPDNTLVSYNGTNGWGDRIGDFIFEVYGIDVRWTGNKLIFQAYTNFDSDGDYLTNWSLNWPSPKPYYYPDQNGDGRIHAYLADFFIDADRNGTFEYGVVMKAHSDWTNCNIYPSDWSSSGSSSLSVGLYNVTDRYQPSAFWSSQRFIYGQHYRNGNSGNGNSSSYTAIKTGSKIGNASVNVYGPNGSPPYLWSIEIDRSALSSYDGKGMKIFWGGANCANDAIYGSTEVPPIPEPGTLILIGSGLIGLAGYSKHKFAHKKR